MILKGYETEFAVIARNVFDLPFFTFTAIYFISALSDALKRYGKKSSFIHFTLAFFTAFIIVALVYLNIGIADK
jgi:hypothetical protein